MLDETSKQPLPNARISYVEAINRLKDRADHDRSCAWLRAMRMHARPGFVPSCDCGLIRAMDAVDQLSLLVAECEAVSDRAKAAGDWCNVPPGALDWIVASLAAGVAPGLSDSEQAAPGEAE
jgi:hypothetical protein